MNEIERARAWLAKERIVHEAITGRDEESTGPAACIIRDLLAIVERQQEQLRLSADAKEIYETFATPDNCVKVGGLIAEAIYKHGSLVRVVVWDEPRRGGA